MPLEGCTLFCYRLRPQRDISSLFCVGSASYALSHEEERRHASTLPHPQCKCSTRGSLYKRWHAGVAAGDPFITHGLPRLETGPWVQNIFPPFHDT